MDFSTCKYCDHSGTELSEMYLKYRPTYPKKTFDTILSYHKGSPNPGFDLAVDVACGTGQATVPLAEYFKEVIGVDISKDMLAVAPRKLPNVSYREASAENMAFIQDASVDMVTVATGLHWLNVDMFIKEVDRILKPGGSFVAFTYYTLGFEHREAGEYMQKFVGDLMENYIDSFKNNFAYGYHGLVTPFVDYKRRDDIDIRLSWTLDHVIGWLKSFSQAEDFVRHNEDRDVFGELKDKLTSLLFGKDIVRGGDEKVEVIFKTFLVMYRKRL